MALSYDKKRKLINILKTFDEDFIGLDEKVKRLEFTGLKTKTAHGTIINADDKAIDRPITGFRIYGKTIAEEYRVSNQLANLPNKSNYVRNGLTWNCSGGIVTVTGTASAYTNTGGAIEYQMPIIPGTYTVSGSSSPVRVEVVVTKADDSQVINRSSNGEPKTFTLDGTEKRASFILSVTQGTEVGEVTIYPMLNEGDTALPWEPYQVQNIINTIGSNGKIEININGNKINQAIESYGLPAIPIQITNSTKESAFTYGDDEGKVWIADYIDFDKGLYYHNIGFIESYDGEDIGSNYISETPNGVSKGDKVFYVLPTNERYTTPLESTLIVNSIYPANMKISNDNDAWMQVDYYVPDERDFSVIPMQTGYLDIKPRAVRFMAKNENMVYLGTRSDSIIQVDITNENNPQIITTKVLDNTYNIVTGMAFQGDYIYASERDQAAGVNQTPNVDPGRLYVLAKEDLDIVKTIVLPWKGAHLGLYKNHLYVPLQLWGFQVYSIANNPEEPELVYEYEHPIMGQREWQQVRFWSADNKDYMAITAFNWGAWFYNITDPENPELVGVFNAKKLRPLNAHQVFDCLVEHPYLYMTIGPVGYRRFAPNHMRGVIRIRIDDLTPYQFDTDPNSADPYQAGFEYAGIDKDDWWRTYLAEGDPHPVTIAKMGDIVVVNNGGKGFALFKATDTELEYLRRVSFEDDTGFARYFVTDESGRLIAASDASQYTSSKRTFAIYRFANMNY